MGKGGVQIKGPRLEWPVASASRLSDGRTNREIDILVQREEMLENVDQEASLGFQAKIKGGVVGPGGFLAFCRWTAAGYLIFVCKMTGLVHKPWPVTPVLRTADRRPVFLTVGVRAVSVSA